MPQNSTLLIETNTAVIAPKARPDATILDRVLLTVVALALLGAVGIVLWGLNRGLDLCDEGYYLLMTQSPQEYVAPTGFHFVLSKLPNITGSLIINLRLYQVISQLVSNTVLVLGFWRLMSSTWFRPTKPQLCTSLLFTALASFLLQAAFPPDLSYNGLTYFFVFSSFGLLFAGTALVADRWKGGKYLIAAAGFFCGFILSVKFSACLLSIALAALWLILNIKERRLWGYYLLGLALAPIVFFSLFQTPLQFKAQIAQIIRFASIVNAFLPNQLIHTYTSDLVFAASTIWHDLGFCLFAPILAVILNAYMIRRTDSPAVKSVSWLIASLCMVPIFLLVRLGDYPLGKWYPVAYAAVLLYLSVILVFMAAKVGEADGKVAQPNRIAVTTITLLFLLPFACSMGTSNPIFLQATTCLPPVFLALSALSFKVFPDFCANIYRFTFMGGLSLLTLWHFVCGYVYHPYFLYDNLIDQKCAADNLSNLKGLRLGREAHQYLSSVSTILKKGGFCPGDPILALYNMPGVVYAVGGTAPSSAWLFSPPGFEKFRPIWFREIRNKVKDRLFIVTSWDLAPKTQEILQKAGIDFPNQFELIGTTQMKPYVDACALADSSAGDHYSSGEVRVYKWKK